MINHRGYRDAGFLTSAFESEGSSIGWLPREDLIATRLDLRGTDVVVSLGSRHDPTRDLHVDYIRREVEFLREAKRQNRHVLGVCFGAQLLSVLDGGRVYRLPATTVGYRTVQFASVALTPTAHFFWNSCGFEPPADTQVMAAGPHSCWSYRRGRTLAVQFHLDASSSLISRWVRESSEDFARAGLVSENLLGAARLLDSSVEVSCRQLLSVLLNAS